MRGTSAHLTECRQSTGALGCARQLAPPRLGPESVLDQNVQEALLGSRSRILSCGLGGERKATWEGPHESCASRWARDIIT